MSGTQVIVGILSCGSKPGSQYEQRRLACDETWAGELRRRGVTALYLIGGLEGEAFARREGDVLRLKCPDTYNCLPQKTRLFCQWVTTNAPEATAFKCDDDTYVHAEPFVKFDPAPHDYVGTPYGQQDFASGGAGYFLSPKAVRIVAERMKATTGAEDVLVSQTLRSNGIRLTKRPDLFSWDYPKDCMPRSKDRLTVHWIPPAQMRRYHTNLKRWAARVRVAGLQRSGTNYVEQLLVQNFGICREHTGKPYWKHALAEDAAPHIDASLPCLLLTKNPYMWIRSLKQYAADFLTQRMGGRRFATPQHLKLVADCAAFYRRFHEGWLDLVGRNAFVRVFQYEDFLRDLPSHLDAIAHWVHVPRISDTVVNPVKVEQSAQFTAAQRAFYLGDDAGLSESEYDAINAELPDALLASLRYGRQLSRPQVQFDPANNEPIVSANP